MLAGVYIGHMVQGVPITEYLYSSQLMFWRYSYDVFGQYSSQSTFPTVLPENYYPRDDWFLLGGKDIHKWSVGRSSLGKG